MRMRRGVGPNLSALGDECRRWLRATWPPMVAYILALLLIAAFAGTHDRILIGLAAVALGATSIWFGHTIRRERRQANYRVGRARLVVAVVVALLSIGSMFSSVLGRWFEVLAFAGLGMLVVSIGGLVSEARRYQRWEHARGPVALGVALLAMSAALIFHPKSGVFVVVAGAGILLAELGTELYSDDRLRTVPLWNPWWTASLGSLVMLVGVGLLVSWGAGLTGGFYFAVVVLAVVWMAASDSDSLGIVMVVALALIWASVPRDVVPDSTLEARRNEPYFLVLGDSFISGEGAQRFYEGTNTSNANREHTNTCRRAPTAWPVRLATGTHPAGIPDRMVFLACSGAVSANIRSTPRFGANGQRQGPAELEELATRRTASGLTEPPAFVLLSVGGNDSGFGTIGKTCVGPGTCAEVGDKFLDALRKVEQQLDATQRDVRAAVGPDVPVITVPYPIPVSDSGACPDVFLSDAERKFVVQFVTELNAVVRSAATRAGSEYMDTMETALMLPGKRLCEGPNPSGLNFLNWHPQAGNLWQSLTPTNWTHNSLHPNEDGHEAMRTAAAQWFEAHPNLGTRQPTDDSPRTVRRVDQMLKFGTTTLCSVRRQESCALEKNQWLYEEGFRLISSSFLPTVLAMVGAWMIAMAPIRWATENNITSATVILRLVRLLRPPQG